MIFTTSLLIEKTLFMLVCIMVSKSSSVTTINSFLEFIPALFTKISILPSLAISAIIPGMSLRLFKSKIIGLAFGPNSSHASSVFSFVLPIM